MRAIGCLAIIALLTGAAMAADAPAKKMRILFLSKSSGFEHSVIAQKKGKPSLVDKTLAKLADRLNAEVTCTKDASLINADNLKNYDVVIFYTTGVLTEDSKDGGANMPAAGPQALLDWIKAGGGFVGYHAASDTFHSGPDGITPFVEMIGGEFETHGQQFKGKLKIVSPGHPGIASIPADYTLEDEWYINKNVNASGTMHVLALLELGAERQNQPEKYNRPDYPIIWCSAYGQGRVLYNGLGHREDVWESHTFQKLVVDNIKWARGEGALDADPNYDAVVPKEIPAK